jgi:hypothetical protein
LENLTHRLHEHGARRFHFVTKQNPRNPWASGYINRHYSSSVDLTRGSIAPQTALKVVRSGRTTTKHTLLAARISRLWGQARASRTGVNFTPLGP